MAFDFPNTPNVGDKYPTAPTTGQPQYIWNGTLWTTHAVSPPGPGKVPVWTDGSAPMSAALTLSGDPVNPTDASDKHYVDSQIGGLASQGNVRYDIAQSLTAPQQAQARGNIGATPIPSGAVMLFYQAAAPIGWTQVTTQNDKALRVVSGSGGVAGGTNPFSTVMAQVATGNHTLTLGEMAAGIQSQATNTITCYMAGQQGYAAVLPNQPGYGWGSIWDTGASGSYAVPYTNANAVTYTTYAQYAQTISVTSNNAGGGAHNHPLTMAIQYCDVIICSKN